MVDQEIRQDRHHRTVQVLAGLFVAAWGPVDRPRHPHLVPGT